MRAQPIRLSALRALSIRPWFLRIDDETEGAAERLDSVAISRGCRGTIRQRHELLVAKQVKRVAVPGDLLEITRNSDFAGPRGGYARQARLVSGEHRRPIVVRAIS